jgi:hypothetical protein
MECFRLSLLLRANANPVLYLWPFIDVGLEMEAIGIFETWQYSLHIHGDIT